MHENAAERRGTHATKNRALVSGSGKKPWRQKGTGRARVGEIRNPLWRKGGTVFGPQPRSYDFTLPKKVERGALRAALAQKLQDGAAGRRRRARRGEIKTKAAAELLKRLGVDRQGGAHRRRRSTRSFARRCATCRASRSCRARASPRATSCDTRRVVATRGALEKLQEALQEALADELGCRMPGSLYETDRRHPPAAHHREDVDPARRRPDDRVPGGAPAPTRSRSSARSRSCSARRSTASARASRTARSSARGGSPASARTGRRPT